MAISESTHEAPEHLAPITATEEELVLYAESVSEVRGELVAGFRPDAQALRVRAIEQGVAVRLEMPEGAKPGIYAEHAAEWILPLIAIPTAVIAQLIGNEIQRRIDAWRADDEPGMPTVRFRQVEFEEEGLRGTIREVEGPADEVAAWLMDAPTRQLKSGEPTEE